MSITTKGVEPSKYSFSSLQKDLIAGVAVFLVALPLCLGISLASNAPSIAGIITGIVGGIVIGSLSGSHTSVSGPTASLIAVVATQIVTLGSFNAFLAALVIAGLIQIALGIFRIGFIADFFPGSVIKGLLAAIGIILVLKQLPHLVGWDIDAEGDMAFMQPDNENTFSEIGRMFFHIHKGAVIVGLFCIALLFIWERTSVLKKSKFPSALAVVIFGVSISLILPFFGETFVIGMTHRVQVPLTSSFSDSLNLIKMPLWDAFLWPEVYLAGLTLALVASLETMLNLGAVDNIDPKQRISPPNREMIAQGIGNTILGLVGGLPVASVIIRSSVNMNAGAQSKISAIAHGFFLLFSVLVIPQWLNTIPLSCLAAILIMTGIKLVNHRIVLNIWREGKTQFFPFIITILAIVFTDLLVGVLVGLAMSIAFIFISNFKNPLRIIREKRPTEVIERIVLGNQVSFLNRVALTDAFNNIPEGGHILIDASHAEYIDTDILNLIASFKDKAKERKITMSLSGFKEGHSIEDQVHYAEHATLQLQKQTSPEQVLQILKEGNKRVLKGKRLQRDLSRQITATATGQFPLGVILSCMDSRAPVELIFDLGIGDIFSVRTAGNTVSEKVLGSLEFACAIAGAKLIVVMGHTRCGAINASIDFYDSKESIAKTTGCQNLEVIIEEIQKVIKISPIDSQKQSKENFSYYITKAHITQCIKAILEQSTIISDLVKNERIAIIGCIYDVTTGRAQFL